MQGEVSAMAHDWQHYLSAAVLVMVRISGLMVFAPIFSSAAIAARIKAGFVFALTLLLAPAIAALPGPAPILNGTTLLGELSVGLLFGMCLTFLSEALMFAGSLLGMQFSFSLVNLLDPNSKVETPVLGQLLGWISILVLLGTGLDRTLMVALVRSFSVVAPGHAALQARSATAVVMMASGIFLAGLQLAAPVIAAALTVEITVSLVGRLSPQLPAMVIGVPLKTLISYAVLIGSLAVWPTWIESHFNALLDAAGKLMVGA